MIEQRRDLSITGIEPETAPVSLAGLPAGFVSRLLALSSAPRGPTRASTNSGMTIVDSKESAPSTAGKRPVAHSA